MFVSVSVGSYGDVDGSAMQANLLNISAKIVLKVLSKVHFLANDSGLTNDATTFPKRYI